jgi:peptidoglycan hydrolase-like protein with peptidoglycan-binding domain
MSELDGSVNVLQQWLNWLGWDTLEVTGVYDAATEAAVREYQEARGLTPTGECDQTTYGYIGADVNTGQRPGPFEKWHREQEEAEARDREWELAHPDWQDDQLRMYEDGTVMRPSERHRAEVEETMDRIRHPLGHAEPAHGPAPGTPGGPPAR